MNSDPNRHEASRAAFEAAHPQFDHGRGLYSYRNDFEQFRWEAWCRALDHAAAQVCEWKDIGHDFINETGCNRAIAYLASDLVDFPFCPGCGRRVKIINNENTCL